MTTTQTCPGCQFEFSPIQIKPHPYLEAASGCWDTYTRVLAKEYSDPDYFKVHRVTVDAYAASHPGRPEARTIQSINLHLIGLCMVFELGKDPESSTPYLQLAKDKFHNEFQWLEGRKKAEICVSRVLLSKDAKSHQKLVLDWGKTVWQSWSNTHAMIRSYCERL